MKKTRLGVKTVVLSIIIGILTVLALTACTDVVVSELSVIEDTVPGVAVVGKFDISGIRLIATDKDGNSNEIAATPSMITTEGKQALSTVGQQSVTLFYGGKTVVISVLIVEEGTETATVIFNDADGKFLGKRTAVKGEAITNPPTATSTDPDKVFSGWYDVGGNKIDLNSVQADATVTARFADNANEYDVIFLDYKGNQVGDTIKVAHGSVARQPGYTMPYEIISFEWKGADVPITQATTFEMSVQYRQYQVQYWYAFESKPEVKYTVNDGSSPLVESVVTGKNATKKSVAEARIASMGLKFINWQNTSTVINADTDMIAIVEDREFTITYKDGVNAPEKYSYLSGTQVTVKMTAAQKEGYTFNGIWYEEGKPSNVYSGTLVIQKDLVLLPKYEKKRTPVKINFTFAGLKEDGTGGGDKDIIETFEDNSTYFDDIVDLAYINAKLTEVKNRNKGEYDGFEVQTVTYEERDVTAEAVRLKTIVGDGYHVFDVTVANSALATEGMTIKYNATLGGYVVEKYDGKSKIINIPETYDDKTNGVKNVVAISANVFEKKEIKSINIPSTVTEIGDKAFSQAVFYGDVVLPDITKLGTGVFEKASTGFADAEMTEKIKISVTFGSGSSLTDLDGKTFLNTTGIYKVVLPESVKKITAVTLATDETAASEIEEINLNSVTVIGAHVFSGASKLHNVGNLDALSVIGENAFKGSALTAVNLPSATSIASGAFNNMPELTSCTVAGISEFSLATVAGCDKLSSITFGAGVTNVKGEETELKGLKEIALGADVAEVTLSAGKLPKLCVLTADSANAKYFAQDNVLFAVKGEGYEIVLYPADKIGDYTVPEMVNSRNVVGLGTLEGANINALTLTAKGMALVKASAENLQAKISGVIFDFGAVENYAQEQFVTEINGLIEKVTADKYYIRIESGVEKPEDLIAAINNAKVSLFGESGTEIKFDYTYRLFYKVNGNEAVVTSADTSAESITVPATLGGVPVAALEKDALVDCTALKTLKIDATVRQMSNLTGCVALENITFKGWTADAEYSVGGYADTAMGKNNNVLVLGGKLVAYNAAAYADDNTKDGTVVTAESLAGVTEIPQNVFGGSAIKSITFSDSVVSIAASAFENCTALETVTFNKVTEIKEKAFFGCTNLTRAQLDEVRGLGTSAFENCTSLESVYIPKRINNGYIPVKAFKGCSSLTEVEIPDEAQIIGFSEAGGTSEAFAECTSLENLSFIKKFAKISASAFNNCSSIKRIDFTETAVAEIGSYAFAGCVGIEYLVFGATVTSVGTKAFYVPEGSKLLTVEFKGTGGLLLLPEPIPADVFPKATFVFYLSGGANTNVLENYDNEIRNTAPGVAFELLEGYGVTGTSFNKPALNDVLYLGEAPEAPVIDGYVFGGWFILNDESKYVKAEFPFNVSDDVVLYAKYFDVNKGSFEDSDMRPGEWRDINGKLYEGLIIEGCSHIEETEIYVPSAYKLSGATVATPVIGIDIKVLANWKGKELTLPEGILFIKNSFVSSDINSVEKLVLPSTVKQIGDKAFVNFKNLKEIVFADGFDADKISPDAFEETVWMSEAEAAAKGETGNGFVVAGNVAIKYFGNEKASLVEIPANVTVLSDRLFLDEQYIEQVSFNNALRIIGEECFKNAKKLTYVSYAAGSGGSSVIAEIGINAFEGTPWLNRQDMVIIGTVLVKHKNISGAAQVNIPDEVTEISAHAFEGNTTVKNLIFGANSRLTKIGDYAFASSAIENIVLPAVTELGIGVFKNCASLRTADLSKVAVEILPKETFKVEEGKISSLTEVKLSPATKELGGSSFAGCSSLSKLTADGISVSLNSTGHYTIDESGIMDSALCNPTATDGDVYVILGSILIKYVAYIPSEDDKKTENTEESENEEPGEGEDPDPDAQLKTAFIPEGVKVIKKNAFRDNAVIERVIFPASLKTIENAAFSGCTGLKKVTFADGSVLEVIEDSAFSGCTEFKEIEFPESLTEIGASAFSQTGLINVTIGNAVTVLGEGAFAGSENLETVVIGDGLSFIGRNVFKDCKNLYKLTWNWTTDAVETTEDNKKLNAFDVIIANIRKELADPDSLDSYKEYIKGIFEKTQTNSRSLRIYFDKNSVSYITGSTDLYVKAWTEAGIGLNVYEVGVFPTVTFVHDENSQYDYYMPTIITEKLDSLDAPSMTGHTFKRWLLPDGSELTFPYYVYEDITLTPEWFVNALDTTADSTELGFTSYGSGYAVSGIKTEITGGTLYIPSTVDSKDVVDINITSTENCAGIEKIVLTNAGAFKDLNVNAFRFFPDLKEVVLLENGAASSMEVRDGVLYSKDGTVLIAYLNRTYTEKDNNEEDVTKKYNEFTVPDGVEVILPYAFKNSGLTTITLGKDVRVIGEYAFNNELETLVFAEGINITDATRESFENTAWYNGNDDNPATFGTGTTVEYKINGSTRGIFFVAGNIVYEYRAISSVDSLVIPETVNGVNITVIASNLNRLTPFTVNSLTLPAHLTKINSEAFYNIDVTQNITAAALGGPLVDIAPDVFADTEFYKHYNNDMLILGSVLVKCVNSSGNIIVPEGVVAISNNAFSDGQVRTVTLPSTLKYIGEEAFLACVNLTSVSIPKNVEVIGARAFESCRQLNSVTFDQANSRLVEIGEYAFGSCYALNNLAIPYTVVTVGENAFINCTALTEATFDYITATTGENEEIIYTVVEKSRLEVLGARAFYNCSNLVTFKVPDGVEAIEEMTFANCVKLENVEFDVSSGMVRRIARQAFYNCASLGGKVDTANPSLVTLVLPNRLETIEEEAFKNCSTLLGVRLNYNVSEINDNAFAGCLRLAKIDVYSVTPADISSTAFDRRSDSGAAPYYYLRIYVKTTTGSTTLGNYKRASGWSAYRENIFERVDLPKVIFTEVTTTATQTVINTLATVQTDIIVNPTVGTKISWRYSSLSQREYDAEGNPTGNMKSYPEDSRVANKYFIDQVKSNEYSYQKQGEDTILVIDYDEVTLEYASRPV